MNKKILIFLSIFFILVISNIALSNPAGGVSAHETLYLDGNLRLLGHHIRSIRVLNGNFPTHFDIDFPEVTNNDVNVRFFRNTPNEGLSRVIFLEPNTSNRDVQIGVGGAPSFFHTGNVGIGTRDPNSELDVRGEIIAESVNVTGNLIARGLNFEESINPTENIRLTSRDVDNWISLRQDRQYGGWIGYKQSQGVWIGSGAHSESDVRISGNAGGFGSGEVGLIVDGSNRVGIGTTSPQAKLHVNGHIRLGSNPSHSMDAATKDYVDGRTPEKPIINVVEREITAIPNLQGIIITPDCGSDRVATGGGFRFSHGDDIRITSSMVAQNHRQWECGFKNMESSNKTITCYAICMRLQS